MRRELVNYLAIIISYEKFRLLLIGLLLYSILRALIDSFRSDDANSAPALIGILLGTTIFCVPIFFLMRSLIKKTIERAEVYKKKSLFNPDKDSFVLYLRSFETETDLFAITMRKPGSGRESMKTFERFFDDSTVRMIGPIFALGSSADYRLDSVIQRNPGRAIREYIDEQNWKDNIQNKIEKCKAIFLQPCTTASVEFELREIAKRGYGTKLFICFKPRMNSTYLRWTIPFWNWLRGTSRLKWDNFFDLLEECGYTISIKAIPPGSIMTFDDKNNALLVKSELVYAQDYLESICERLNHL